MMDIREKVRNAIRELKKNDTELKAIIRAFNDDQYRLSLTSNVYEATGLHKLSTAHVKRFLEWYGADEKFRVSLYNDPKATFEAYNIDLDPDEIEVYWDPEEAVRKQGESAFLHPSRLRYEALIDIKLNYRDELVDCNPVDSRWSAWRNRQIRRSRLTLGKDNSDNIIHAPVAIELSQGCSVGCWFCGVSAAKLKGHWPYKGENIQLWKEVCHVIHELTGSASDKVFHYWATEPLDNRDYLKFCRDWKQISGFFPQTTTAIPMRDPAFTRQMLRESTLSGTVINRFSILTTRILKQVYEEFSPEELLFVEVVCQNKGSLLMKAEAGRAREKTEVLNRDKVMKQKAVDLEKGEVIKELNRPSTIACVSGFLINLPSKTIKLISPCRASDTWPDGFHIFEQARFQSANELKEVMNEMIKKHMQVELSNEIPLQVIDTADIKINDTGFTVRAYEESLVFKNDSAGQYFRTLGELIDEGCYSKSEIIDVLRSNFGIGMETTEQVLRKIFDNGVLGGDIQVNEKTRVILPR